MLHATNCRTRRPGTLVAAHYVRRPVTTATGLSPPLQCNIHIVCALHCLRVTIMYKNVIIGVPKKFLQNGKRFRFRIVRYK